MYSSNNNFMNKASIARKWCGDITTQAFMSNERAHTHAMIIMMPMPGLGAKATLR